MADAGGLRLAYLGCVPLKESGETVAHSAIEILMVKLEKLQAKMVDKVVEKKHGTRLSRASPVYQKVAAKLQKQGLDCTQGDPVTLVVDSPTVVGTVEMVEEKNGSVTTIPLAQMLQLTVLPSRDEGKVVFAFIQEAPESGIVCHGLLCKPAVAEQTRSSLMVAMATLVKADSKHEKRGATAKPKHLGDNDSKITFGVGLHRKSSLRVSGQVRRQGTINLKGRKNGDVKRRSSSYGNTFASLGSMGLPTAAPSGGSGGGDDDALSTVDDEDDLFGGFDDDIFGDDDFSGATDNPNLGTGEDDEEIDLGMFGFDD